MLSSGVETSKMIRVSDILSWDDARVNASVGASSQKQNVVACYDSTLYMLHVLSQS